jgi:hypothetical protein
MLDYLDPTPIATNEQFKRALLAVRDRDGISPTELGMRRAHCRAPKHTITSTKLAHEADLTSYAVANLQYGTFAHAVADRLGYTPIKRDDGTTCWWFTLSVGADESDDTDESRFEWIMRPELVQALQEMKWPAYEVRPRKTDAASISFPMCCDSVGCGMASQTKPVTWLTTRSFRSRSHDAAFSEKTGSTPGRFKSIWGFRGSPCRLLRLAKRIGLKSYSRLSALVVRSSLITSSDASMHFRLA